MITSIIISSIISIICISSISRCRSTRYFVSSISSISIRRISAIRSRNMVSTISIAIVPMVLGPALVLALALAGRAELAM